MRAKVVCLFCGALDINDGTKYSANGFSGYTVGGGLEYKLTPSWSVKDEYQYMDFGFSATLPSSNAFNVNLEAQTAKFGVNYHVGGSYSPLK
jgi:outer membrane immunogenic protein